MTIAAGDFVNRVLSAMPETTPRREQIALELRGLIGERLAAWQPLPEVLDQLGDPETLAESYPSAVPLEAGCFWSRATARLIDFAIPVVLLSPIAATIWLATPACAVHRQAPARVRVAVNDSCRAGVAASGLRAKRPHPRLSRTPLADQLDAVKRP